MIRDTERAADSLYLIAHHCSTGRPYLGPRVLGVGLAGALLGELALIGLVQLQDGRVYALDRPPYRRRVQHYSGGLYGAGLCPESHRPVNPMNAASPCPNCYVKGTEEVPEPLQREVWQVILHERTPHSVHDWLTGLAHDAATRVAERLERDGWLAAEQRRTWIGRSRVQWTPVNSATAGMPQRTLLRIVQGLEPADEHRQLVAVLADTLALTRTVLADLGHAPGQAKALPGLVRSLGGPLQYLVTQTKATADSVIMSHTG